MVFVINTVNIMLKFVLRIIIKHERKHDLTQQVISTTFLLFFVTFFNTSCILLLINMNIDIGLPDWFPILAGDYGEFTTEWYWAIGASILMTMIIGIISPHIANSFWWMLAFVKKCWDRKMTCNSKKTK